MNKETTNISTIALILIFIFSNINAIAQDFFNQYLDHSVPVAPATGIMPRIQNFNHVQAHYEYNSYVPSPVPAYNGEYEIYLGDLFKEWSINPIQNLAVSFQYEVVSFPFTLSCAFEPNGCADPPGTTVPSPRNLYMPDTQSPYNSVSNTWDNSTVADLFRITPLRAFVNNFSSEPSQAHSLISSFFLNDSPPATTKRRIIPHSVIKHTINIHCGQNILDPVAYSFDFLFDNTRGRMTIYPFIDNNLPIGLAPSKYDQVFYPRFLMNGYWEGYDESIQPVDMVIPSGIIKQYKYSDISNGYAGCTEPLTTIPSISDIGFIYPYPGAVLTSPMRQYKGKLLAGYSEGNVAGELVKRVGLPHTYYVDAGYPQLDLSIINSLDKVIYNPSETYITANIQSFSQGVIFPSNYTFKTIRGSYPSVTEVNAANTVANGGAYIDLRDVPVPTDLSSTTDPADASVYNIVQGSMITVQPCVTIYDATFNLEDGSAIVFNDWDQTYGKHRFKIDQSVTGYSLIVRNKRSTQYLQNGAAFNNYTLTCDATANIRAGEAVDPDQSATQGEFLINPGADITFHAGNSIKLESGFHAKTGSTFKTNIAPVPSYFPCAPAGNRLTNISIEQLNQKENINDLKVFPNPISEDFNVRAFISNDKIVNIDLCDSFGRVVRNLAEQHICVEGVNNFSFSVNGISNGLYTCRMSFNDGSTKSLIERIAIVR